MKKVIFLLLLFPFTLSFSQNRIDTAFLKCSYKYSYQKDTINNLREDDLLYLQVGKSVSKCYSYYTFQSDSLRSTKDGEKVWHQLFMKALKEANGGTPQGGFPYKRMRTFVYKNYPQGKMTVTDGISLQDYIYEDELNAQNWDILDSTRVILGYLCQRAECNFRGRQWTAWFAPDVPISDGPWKFSGLPGLIMEVYDKGEQYHFLINGLENLGNEPIVFNETISGNNKFEKTNRKAFLKAAKRYLMDANGYIELETGIDLGSDTSQKVMRYDLIELDYK